MKLTTYFWCGLLTTLNIIINAVTRGRVVWLEGRVRRAVFINWGRRFRYRPLKFVQPTTEAEIIELLQNAKHVRVFGSAHSFNAGVVTEGTLVSLDKYSGVIGKDLQKKQITVKGGTRMRDVIKVLHDEGLAFAALPSHDAQSIGGILATDVHGTGRDWGFVSQSVVRLKIINGKGEVLVCEPADDLFKAAIGGIGAVGIIVEVVVQGVDRFNVAQKVEVADLAYVEKNLDQLIQENDHVSLYLFPFADKCQINTWNRTAKRKSWLGPLREFLTISLDALLAAWMGNLAAYLGFLPAISFLLYRVKKGSNLVLESNQAFNRTIYHTHQELEFTVPFARTFELSRRFLARYEEMYPTRLPYMLLEVRFTPAGHDRTLIGPGQEQRCTWIDLVCNDSDGFESYYEAAEKIIKQVEARPHLGKSCLSWERADFERMYCERFTRFCQLMAAHDPEGKFANQFLRQLFGQKEEVAALMGLVEVPDVNDGQEGQEQPKEGNGDNLAARVRHARLPY